MVKTKYLKRKIKRKTQKKRGGASFLKPLRHAKENATYYTKRALTPEPNYSNWSEKSERQKSVYSSVFENRLKQLRERASDEVKEAYDFFIENPGKIEKILKSVDKEKLYDKYTNALGLLYEGRLFIMEKIATIPHILEAIKLNSENSSATENPLVRPNSLQKNNNPPPSLAQ